MTITDANGCTSTAISTLTDPPAPTVTLALTVDTVCVNLTSFALTGGSPTGGSYSGTGVSLGNFNPASASLGNNVITYSYTDANGCSASTTGTIYVDPCAGIATYSQDGLINVYPNPTTGILNVETTMDENMITIVDVLGNVVYSTKSTSVKTAIDMSSFANGIYFLKVENEKNVTTIRIVRSK